MAGAKVGKDPFKSIREKIPSLQKHAEAYRNRLKGDTVPEKHNANPISREAYKAWLRSEIQRTETKISDLQMSLPAGK